MSLLLLIFIDYLFIFQAIPPMAHEINDRDTDILQCDLEAYGPDINESETDGLL